MTVGWAKLRPQGNLFSFLTVDPALKFIHAPFHHDGVRLAGRRAAIQGLKTERCARREPETPAFKLFHTLNS